MAISPYSGFPYESERAVIEAREQNLSIARITEQQRGLYRLEGQQGPTPGSWWADISGRLRFQLPTASDLPTVGDWVIATAGAPTDRLQILQILPRQSTILRRAAGLPEQAQLLAANVDLLAIVSSLNQDVNPSRLQRYRLLAAQAGIEALLLLTKSDLMAEPLERGRCIAGLDRILPILCLSAANGEGMAVLRERCQPGKTVAFIGSSGVGKSTLVNALLGEHQQDTGDIRFFDARGRHTTSSRSLFQLANGAWIMDTPGLRELGLWGLDEGVIDESFQDISSIIPNCRYRNCRHEQEPGCALREAIIAGAVDEKSLHNYQKLQREQARQDLLKARHKPKAKRSKPRIRSWGEED